MLYRETCICAKCGKKYTVWNGGIVSRVEIPVCGECRKEGLKKIKDIIKGKR